MICFCFDNNHENYQTTNKQIEHLHHTKQGDRSEPIFYFSNVERSIDHCVNKFDKFEPRKFTEENLIFQGRKFTMPSNDDAGPSSDEVADEVRSIISKVVDDIGKGPAIRQLMIGGAAGWLTGFTLIKVGKATAAAIGSGIFLLQIANHNGYIKINWDKVSKKAEELSEKLDEPSSKPNLLKKVEKYVDKKLDKAESVLKKKERKVKKWYCRRTDSECFIFEEIHVFIVSFLAGMALGITCGAILR